MNINSRVRVYLRRDARSLIYQREYSSASDYTQIMRVAREILTYRRGILFQDIVSPRRKRDIIMYACSLRIFIGSRERNATFKILIK